MKKNLNAMKNRREMWKKSEAGAMHEPYPNKGVVNDVELARANKDMQ